jgi:hypothetical protein
MPIYHAEHHHVVRGCEYKCRSLRLTRDQNIEIALQEEEFGKFKLINGRYSREGDFKSHVQTFASPW